MKLLFISRTFPPTIGGIENQNEALSRYLSKQISCKKIVNRHGKKALPFFIPWAIITGLINIRKSDQLLLGDGVAAIIGWFIKLFSNKPVSCVLHGLDITWSNSVYQKLWVSCFFNKIDHFIVVSHSTKDIAIKAGIPEAKVSVIPNGVELSSIQPLSKKVLQQNLAIGLENKFVLLSLGRLVERKGVLWFVENVAHKLPSNMIYLIAGEGPNYDKITLLINQLSLTDKVYLLGAVSNQIRQSLFAHADLFVQPNIPVDADVEGFGITQLEAGVCGLPSVSSSLEGIKDAVHENENGWLVEPLSASSFIKTILEKQELLNTRREATRSHIEQYCHSNFNWPNIASHYLYVLKRIMHKTI